MLKNSTRVAAHDFALAFAFAVRRLVAPCAMSLAVLLALALPGCSGGCSRENTPDAPAPILDRMEDPEYTKLLNECLAEQQKVVARDGKVLRELEAARAENPESEKVKELEKRHAEITAELEKLRTRNMAIVRKRIQQEKDDRAKAASKENK